MFPWFPLCEPPGFTAGNINQGSLQGQNICKHNEQPGRVENPAGQVIMAINFALSLPWPRLQDYTDVAAREFIS
jgi:hypothetical protein